jgi:predicted metalloprotease with PDZ domain
MLLDLEVRSSTDGKKSLLDVLHELYHRFYEAPAGGYYGPGRGYEESDVLEAINSVSGRDFAQFFQNYVSGIAPLPLQQDLAMAGLRLRIETPRDAPPLLGIAVQPEVRGTRITSVVPGGAADRAGLSRDDLMIDIDDQSLATDDLATRLSAYPAGTTVPINIERHGRRERVEVKLDPPESSEYSIVPLPSVTAEQKRLREAWLAVH